MAGALAVATYHSRSLVPAIMAAVIVVVLLPSLKATLLATFPRLGWGTGYGSAWIALAPAAAGLPPARSRLPARPRARATASSAPSPSRSAATTTRSSPARSSPPSLFLVVKVDTWTVLNHLDQGLPARTGIALFVTGVVWTLLAVFFRRHALARAGVHLGWVTASVGLAVAYDRLAAHPRAQWPIVAMLVLLQAAEVRLSRSCAPPSLGGGSPREAHALRRARRRASSCPWRSWARSSPAVPSRRCTRWPLVVAFELARHGLARRTYVEGAALFLLGVHDPPRRDRPRHGAALRAALRRAVAGAHARRDHRRPAPAPASSSGARGARGPRAPAGAGPGRRRRCWPFGVALWVLNGVGGDPALPRRQQLLLLAAVVLTARGERSGLLALLAASLAYLATATTRRSRAIPDVLDRVDFLLEPWRWSLFALALAVLAGRGTRDRQAAPRPARRSAPAPGQGAGRALAGGRGRGLRDPGRARPHRERDASATTLFQLATPYVGALTTVVVAWSAGWSALFPAAAALLALGNVHAVRYFAGDVLRARGSPTSTSWPSASS